MKPDDISPFYHLTGPYNCKVQDYEMAQNLVAPVAWMLAIQRFKPRMVIEIGTGAGGLAALLSSVTASYGGEFHTIEVLTGPEQGKYPLSGKARFHQWDCFEHVQEIAQWIRTGGTAFVLCDGGDKPKEFNTFAPFLKEGDVIGVHDWAFDMMAHDQNFWDHVEVTFDDIYKAIENHELKTFMHQWFVHSGWCVQQRRN